MVNLSLKLRAPYRLPMMLANEHGRARYAALLGAALLLSSCVTKTVPARTLSGPVTYDVNSWGRTVLHWQVNPDGTGEIWRLSEQKDAGVLRKYRLRFDDANLATFAARAEELRRATQGGIACKKEIFDLPYGSLTWDYPGAKQTYAFDAGCRSAKGNAAMEQLRDASDLVETSAQIDADPFITEPAAIR